MKLLSFSWRRRREDNWPRDFGIVPEKEQPRIEIATSLDVSSISGIVPVRPLLNSKKRFAVVYDKEARVRKEYEIRKKIARNKHLSSDTIIFLMFNLPRLGNEKRDSGTIPESLLSSRSSCSNLTKEERSGIGPVKSLKYKFNTRISLK